jgi:hypothetical protein
MTQSRHLPERKSQRLSRRCLDNRHDPALPRLSGQCESHQIRQTPSDKLLVKEKSQTLSGIFRRAAPSNVTLDFDEIGGTETPELAKLVAPHLTSSCHALEGLGVNFEECCGFFRVDQRLDLWVTDCRNSCGWFLCKVHCVSPLVGGAIRSKSLSFSFFEGYGFCPMTIATSVIPPSNKRPKMFISKGRIFRHSVFHWTSEGLTSLRVIQG